MEAVGLWLSVLAIVLATRSYSPISSLLMLPYLAWVSVAMLLNWTTIQLNGPFGRG
ncbi:MAG: tryptophan-rich sensory protein [Polynucleobacter sp.]